MRETIKSRWTCEALTDPRHLCTAAEDVRGDEDAAPPGWKTDDPNGDYCPLHVNYETPAS